MQQSSSAVNICYISLTENSITCTLLELDQLQPSGVGFHQGFWFNIEFDRHSIMCFARRHLILASPPLPHRQRQSPWNSYTLGKIWPDKTQPFLTCITMKEGHLNKKRQTTSRLLFTKMQECTKCYCFPPTLAFNNRLCIIEWALLGAYLRCSGVARG